MEWINILSVFLGALGTFLSVGVPLIVKLINSVKSLKSAKNDAEKEKAFNDMFSQAISLIREAEIYFESYDKELKAQGGSAAALKKGNVMGNLEEYAHNNGYEYDAEFWSKRIDEIVEFTRTVNAHPNK